MKRLIAYWLLAKTFLFLFCWLIFLPIGVINIRAYFQGSRNFFHRVIDDFEKLYPETKQQCDELRREIN